MPLSKERDRLRKQEIKKLRLENVQFQPNIVPLYNPSKHMVGDTVKVNGKVVKIPELDADGNPIPEV